jgi:hypothetical protein
LWDATEWMGNDGYFNMGWILPVPDGADLARVACALTGVIERYDTLRTTFAVHDGQLHQHVAAEGTVHVAVHESPPGEDRNTAEEILTALLPGGFRPLLDWPTRVAVVTANGTPKLLVLAINHLSLDLHGWRVVERALTRLLADDGGLPPPRNGVSPVWVTRHDQSTLDVTPRRPSTNKLQTTATSGRPATQRSARRSQPRPTEPSRRRHAHQPGSRSTSKPTNSTCDTGRA